MSPALQESLFDINKKTSRPCTEGETGTGFGMHIMKSFNCSQLTEDYTLKEMAIFHGPFHFTQQFFVLKMDNCDS